MPRDTMPLSPDAALPRRREQLKLAILGIEMATDRLSCRDRVALFNYVLRQVLDDFTREQRRAQRRGRPTGG